MSSRFIKGITILLTIFSVASCAQQGQDNAKMKNSSEVILLPPLEFNSKMNETAGEQIIDVRTPEEFESGHIPNAQNINIYDEAFDAKIGQLAKNKAVFVYCKGGSRSADAAEKMKSAGFEQIHDLKGGMMSWNSQNLPVEQIATGHADGYTRKDYDKMLENNQRVLIDYYAPWCGPCLKMEPILEKLSQEFNGKVLIQRINVDDATGLTKELKIENIPVITTHKQGMELRSVSGYQSEEDLRALIMELLK